MIKSYLQKEEEKAKDYSYQIVCRSFLPTPSLRSKSQSIHVHIPSDEIMINTTDTKS
jgi:hypothetical protein